MLLLLATLLAGCGGGSATVANGYAPASRIYPEPGPPGDPWRPYIRQAANRFDVPQQWVRAVMHQESGGHEYRNGQPIVSGAGAMGLMQLMPATYAELQAQYGLGSDPFEPHDNIMAGTGYIRQMFERYGAPGFLAAYNAGPQRLDDYLNRGRRLPNETENYVASIAPRLGTEVAMSGPLAVYAAGGGGSRYAAVAPARAPIRLAAYRVRRKGSARPACWHDPDAAFDPDAPCGTAPVRVAPVQVAAMQVAAVRTVSALPVAMNDPAAPAFVPVRPAIAPDRPVAAGCDPDAAFDSPCRPAPMVRPVMAAAAIVRRPAAPAPSQAVGDWAIQVGAFNTESQARFATTMARQAGYRVLAGSQSVVQQTVPFGHAVLYRARLAGLARDDAGSACAVLRDQSIPCMVVAPGG